MSAGKEKGAPVQDVDAELKHWTKEAKSEASAVAAQLEHALRLDNSVSVAASRLGLVREQLEQTLMAQERALEVCDEIGREQLMVIRQLEAMVDDAEKKEPAAEQSDPAKSAQTRVELLQRAADLDSRLKQMKDVLSEIQVGLDSMLEHQSGESVTMVRASESLGKNDDAISELGVRILRRKASEDW